MPHAPDEITLTDRHYVTLILRLTLDRTGQLLLGELLDTTDTLPKRFIGLTGLHQSVEVWLRQQERAEDDNSSAHQTSRDQRGALPQIPKKGN